MTTVRKTAVHFLVSVLSFEIYLFYFTIDLAAIKNGIDIKLGNSLECRKLHATTLMCSSILNRD